MNTRKHTVSLVASSILCAMLAVTLRADTYYVRQGNSDANSGTNWAEAVGTIAKGVELAVNPGDEVVVSNGTYTLAAQILITNAITVRSLTGADDTIVDGMNAVRCFAISNAAAVLDGFTVRRGLADTLYGGVRLGGGAWLFAGTIQNSIFRENVAGTTGLNGYGGGIYFASGAIISNCVFYANRAHFARGGALANYYHEGGRVVDCVFWGNWVWQGSASQIYIKNGLVDRCKFYGPNYPGFVTPGGYDSGTPVEQVGGTNRSSLFVGHRFPSTASFGTIFLNGGGAVLENATIVDNKSYNKDQTVAIRSNWGGSTIRNSIVYGNWGTLTNMFVSDTLVTNSLINPAVAVGNNLTGDPMFVNAAAGDYRLSLASPAINAGTNQPWMTDARDLAGNPRVSPAGGRVDLGAYETAVDALACTPEASTRSGFAPLEVVLTAFVTNPSPGDIFYRWSFTNSAVIDRDGLDRRVVTNLYPSGSHTVTLHVSNILNGATASTTITNMIQASPTNLYVRADSASPDFPYATWATAASTLQTAIDAAVDGATVWVSNGVYTVSQRVRIEKGITVRSLNGAAHTSINGNQTTGGVRMEHLDAVLWGFSVTNSLYSNSNVSDDYGGGVSLRAGEVKACIIGWNRAHTGGGVSMSHYGILRNCLIVSNSTHMGTGPAVNYLPFNYFGLIDSCEVRGHQFLAGSYNGTMMLFGGILRNSLIVNNAAYGAGGVRVLGGGTTIENCTIAFNSTTDSGATVAGGVSGTASEKLYNTIIVSNTSASGVSNYRGLTSMYHSNVDPAWTGTGSGNLSVDPLFVNAAAGNFRLRSGSDCINAGTNLAWMTAGALDLDGNPRVVQRKPDIGAYESSFARGAVLMVR